MYRDRIALYRKLEHLRESRLIVMVTGDRRGLETQISPEFLDYMVDHLDVIQRADKISLFLYTRGGSITAAWSIISLIRQFCDELEVIVPSRAHSAGTLMCLGANRIIMTKQATLGPIDPSITNHPLAPAIPGQAGITYPVSVEDVRGFIELAREEMKISDGSDFTQVLLKLCDSVHPLILGNVFRATSQIRMLARRMLKYQVSDSDTVERIVAFLVSDSGSHDYTISRTEAKNDLGLNIEKPDDELYGIIKAIFTDIKQELQLNEPYDPQQLATSTAPNPYSYSFKRALLESVEGGSDAFVKEGQLIAIPVSQNGITVTGIQDNTTYEGWRHEQL
ncbi:MAG: ATP-dependent Clp protease proteolytic subunit [Alicyclobacillus sp.]|nr:ATP-dependent Clp protease proteolytic subunit [Alicyclobacillus sp.]